MEPERDIAGRQSQGDRPYQEDYYQVAIEDALGVRGGDLLVVVADGMGGHAAGDIASRVATENFLREFSESLDVDTVRLSKGLRGANEAIRKLCEEEPQTYSGMGTTLVAAFLRDNMLRWTSIGDSTLYHFSRASKQFKRLNDDHSMAPILAAQVERGEMTAEDAENHPDRNVLRSAIIGEPLTEGALDQGKPPVEVEKGDMIIVATDGLDTLPLEKLRATIEIHEASDASVVCKQLIQTVESRRKDRQDNITVVVFRVV
tara:strand:+ start:12507 stop:13286 length:780 start_codon:yes stop_codon:yes gene_type:complete